MDSGYFKVNVVRIVLLSLLILYWRFWISKCVLLWWRRLTASLHNIEDLDLDHSGLHTEDRTSVKVLWGQFFLICREPFIIYLTSRDTEEYVFPGSYLIIYCSNSCKKCTLHRNSFSCCGDSLLDGRTCFLIIRVSQCKNKTKMYVFLPDVYF